MANKHLPQSDATNAYDLLSEIVNLILDEPLRYNQGSWLFLKDDLENHLNIQAPACNTVGCVAGWAVSLKDLVPVGYNTHQYFYADRLQANARKLLGLSPLQAEELFEGSAPTNLFWAVCKTKARLAGTPFDYNEAAPKKQTPEYALLGAIHIRVFQAKYAGQLRAKAV